MKSHFLLLAVALFLGVSQGYLVIKKEANGIILECPHIKEWEKDGVTYEKLMANGNVKLAKLSDSDTGEYSCIDGPERSSVSVFIKLCRNCVELDPSTISGIVVGDIIATVFIALAIYCVTTSNKDKASQVPEKQDLVPHDHNDVYQHLGNRRGSCEYSQLSPRLKI
ncbi:T-cell surface glycoprotein CD3 delta chain-like isoform X2 [Scyliorhinus torazame]|uniref:T-cell surface glycoprotein CD3 delta chain-like isoform X2 n=1 Tax=Scyliorhinus torazame TaxID=75743 RepID=UPI003B5B7556